MSLPRPFIPFLVLALAPLGLNSLNAEQAGLESTRGLMLAGMAGMVGLPAADEERDAREIADRINEALNIHQEVTIMLLNDTTVMVTGRVTTQRYWVIITAPDRSEFRFRAAMIASVRIR